MPRGPSILIAAVLFGVIVWFAVAMREQYTITTSAPLTIERVPEGRAIRTPVPSSLQVRLRGSGWQLASLLWASDLHVTFPYNQFHGAKRSITAGDVADRIVHKPGIQLVDMIPETVYVELDRTTQRTVPVMLDCQVQCREGYGQVGLAVVSPESVTVSGAEEVLRTVDSWSTVHTVFDNVKTTIETDLPLTSSATYLLSLSLPSVHVRINVEPFAEKTMSGIPVEVRGEAPGREVILIPPKVEVVVRGGIRQLSNLTNADLRMHVDYADIVADSTAMVEAVVEAPAGIQVVAKKPEKLHYVVRTRVTP